MYTYVYSLCKTKKIYKHDYITTEFKDKVALIKLKTYNRNILLKFIQYIILKVLYYSLQKIHG